MPPFDPTSGAPAIPPHRSWSGVRETRQGHGRHVVIPARTADHDSSVPWPGALCPVPGAGYNPPMASFRRAAFLAVGSELLRTDRLDTNSLLAGRLLAPCGFAFVEKRCVEDDAGAIAAAITEMLARAELVIVSGGLGPTEDDVTREAAARALGIGLARDSRLEAALVARFRARGRELPAIALRMADVLDGAEVLENPVGTAPGQLVHAGRGTLVLLPGVPVELEQILVAHLVPRWAAAHGRRDPHAAPGRRLRVAGRGAREAPVRAVRARAGHDPGGARARCCSCSPPPGSDGAQELAEMEAAFAAVAGADLVRSRRRDARRRGAGAARCARLAPGDRRVVHRRADRRGDHARWRGRAPRTSAAWSATPTRSSTAAGRAGGGAGGARRGQPRGRGGDGGRRARPGSRVRPRRHRDRGPGRRQRGQAGRHGAHRGGDPARGAARPPPLSGRPRHGAGDDGELRPRPAPARAARRPGEAVRRRRAA